MCGCCCVCSVFVLLLLLMLSLCVLYVCVVFVCVLSFVVFYVINTTSTTTITTTTTATTTTTTTTTTIDTTCLPQQLSTTSHYYARIGKRSSEEDLAPATKKTRRDPGYATDRFEKRSSEEGPAHATKGTWGNPCYAKARVGKRSSETEAAPAGKKPRYENMEPSALADSLLSALGTGGSCVRTIVDHSRAAVADEGACSEAIKKIASVGSRGEHRQNEERDLLTWLQNLNGIDATPQFLKLMLNSKKTSAEAVETRVPVLPIHEMIHSIHGCGETEFRNRLLGPDGALGVKRYWENALKQPWAQLHPTLKDPERTLPLYFHADGVEIYTSSEYVVWSWSTPTVKGEPFDSQFPLMMIPAKFMPTAEMRIEAERALVGYINYCFEVLLVGEFPDRDYYGNELEGKSRRLAGKKIAGGWTAVFASYKGDAKARKESHLFARHYQAGYICEGCFAGDPLKMHAVPKELSYRDFTMKAWWRKTLVNHEAYVASTAVLSPWFSIPGARVERVLKDIAHTCHLGICKDLVSSIVVDLLERGELDGAGGPDEKLRSLWADLQHWCHENGHPTCAGKFTLASLGRSQTSQAFPQLSHTSKACHVRTMVAWIAALVSGQTSDEHGRLRANAAWNMNEFLSILEASPLLMSSEQCEQAHRAAYMYLLSWQQLAYNAAQSGKFLYKIRPKHHYLCHIVDEMLKTKVNPLRESCLPNEAYLGKVKRLTRQCHGGNAMLRFLQRYLLNLGLSVGAAGSPTTTTTTAYYYSTTMHYYTTTLLLQLVLTTSKQGPRGAEPP